jgi:hypothetical protein
VRVEILRDSQILSKEGCPREGFLGWPRGQKQETVSLDTCFHCFHAVRTIDNSVETSIKQGSNNWKQFCNVDCFLTVSEGPWKQWFGCRFSPYNRRLMAGPLGAALSRDREGHPCVLTTRLIEEFLKAHEHTIAAITATGTVGAVVTSLWLAWRANRADRTRLKTRADIVSIFFPGTPKNAPKFLRVSITNHGKFPLRIPSTFFYWKVPFRREVMAITPPFDFVGSPLIAKKTYPTEITSRASDYFVLSDVETFEREVKRMRGADTLADRLRFRFIRAYVETDDGETFRVRLSQQVRDSLDGSLT